MKIAPTDSWQSSVTISDGSVLNAVFLFCGRKKEYDKALYFCKDGLYSCKRLDNGENSNRRNAEVKDL